MPFSVRSHLRGNKTDNPVHLRTMALQFADRMLQPPVYPSLGRNRIRGDASNCLIECQPNLEREQNFFPSFLRARSFQLPRSEAPNDILRVSQWLQHVERAGSNRSDMPAGTLEWLNERARGDQHRTDNHLRVSQWIQDVEYARGDRHRSGTNIRVSQWIQDVENARGDRQRAQQKARTRVDEDDAAKDASAKTSNIRDSLQSCLQSMQPTLEIVRERHTALIESLSDGISMPQTDCASGKAQWEVYWEDPANKDNENLGYLTSVVESEWFRDGEIQ